MKSSKHCFEIFPENPEDGHKHQDTRFMKQEQLYQDRVLPQALPLEPGSYCRCKPQELLCVYSEVICIQAN